MTAPSLEWRDGPVGVPSGELQCSSSGEWMVVHAGDHYEVWRDSARVLNLLGRVRRFAKLSRAKRWCETQAATATSSSA